MIAATIEFKNVGKLAVQQLCGGVLRGKRAKQRRQSGPQELRRAVLQNESELAGGSTHVAAFIVGGTATRQASDPTQKRRALWSKTATHPYTHHSHAITNCIYWLKVTRFS